MFWQQLMPMTAYAASDAMARRNRKSGMQAARQTFET
jgi:hypothetical protein